MFELCCPLSPTRPGFIFPSPGEFRPKGGGAAPPEYYGNSAMSDSLSSGLLARGGEAGDGDGGKGRVHTGVARPAAAAKSTIPTGTDCHVSAHKPTESDQKAGGSTELSVAPPSTSVRAAIGTFPLRRRLPDCLVRQGEIFLQLTRRHLTLSLFMRRKPGSSSQAGRGTVEKGSVCSNCGRSGDGVIQTMFSLP